MGTFSTNAIFDEMSQRRGDDKKLIISVSKIENKRFTVIKHYHSHQCLYCQLLSAMTEIFQCLMKYDIFGKGDEDDNKVKGL